MGRFFTQLFFVAVQLSRSRNRRSKHPRFKAARDRIRRIQLGSEGPTCSGSCFVNRRLETGDLAGGFKHFLEFSPRKLGKIPILTHIFQMGGPTTNQRLDDIFFLGLEKKTSFWQQLLKTFVGHIFFLLQVYSLYNSMYNIAILYIYT